MHQPFVGEISLRCARRAHLFGDDGVGVEQGRSHLGRDSDRVGIEGDQRLVGTIFTPKIGDERPHGGIGSIRGG